MNNIRPLSPHLSIHKKVLTAVFSIFHRITGIGLSIGAILISIWFLLVSLGPTYFLYFEVISKNILFKIVLILWKSGFKISEIKTIFRNRTRGESSVNLSLIAQSLVGLFKLYLIKKSSKI